MKTKPRLLNLVKVIFVIPLLFLSFSCPLTVDRYTVTYDGNGNTHGTIPVDNNTYPEGHIVTVLGNTGNLALIDGVTDALGFDGWNTEKDGHGTNYSTRTTFTMGASDMVLYAQWKPFSIRDTGPAGGLVFYEKVSYSDGWRYLEAAPASTGWSRGEYWEGVSWGGHGTLVGGTGIGIGTGSSNTQKIVDELGEGDYAAYLCENLDYGGYCDWFLPSLDELSQMFDNLHKHGVGSFPIMYYWSSSEENGNDAWQVSFDQNTAAEYSKLGSDRVRAARTF